VRRRSRWLGACACLALAGHVAGCGDDRPAAPEPQPAPPPIGSITSYTSEFGATENPIDEGGTWINGRRHGGNWNDVRTASGHARASVLSGDPSRYNDSIAVLNTTFDADQYAQGTVYRAAGYDPAPSKHEVELLLRFHIGGRRARGYEILWGVSGYLAVVRWNGPLGDYTPLLDSGDPGIGAPADGDVLRAEIRGDTIRVLKNGSLVATVDLTSAEGPVWKSGQPGIGFWPVDHANPERLGWKDFAAGNR